MAKQIEGVYERVLVCARQEFLEEGFADASLRTIAKNARTSTGSIYTRFGDKEGLFREVVEPVSSEFKQMFLDIQEAFHHFDRETQSANLGTYTAKEQERLFDFMYEHFEVFQLLLDASYGTQFASFVDDLVLIEVDYTYKYMEVIHGEWIKTGAVTEEFLHIITTAYFNGVFEVIRHNMDREDARGYIHQLSHYYMAGFSAVLPLQP